jgi:hypothetical protein
MYAALHDTVQTNDPRENSMRLIAKVAPAAVAAPLLAMPLLVTACSSASTPAASATATAASTASSAPPAPASSAQTAPATSSGGSFGSLTAEQIGSKANADLKAAKSFHVSGSITAGNDINLTSASGNCSGKITDSGTTERFVQIGATLWINTGGDSMYIKTSTAGSPNSQVFELCDPSQLASVLGPLPGLTKAGTTVVGGRRVEKLSVAGVGSIDVTISSTPEYVRFTAPGETLTFSGINAPVSINPPPASDVIGA